MKDKKRDKQSRNDKLESERQKMRKASVIDEITINIPNNESKKKKNKRSIKEKNDYNEVDVFKDLYEKNDDDTIEGVNDFDEYENTSDIKKHKKKGKNSKIIKGLLITLVTVILIVVGGLGYKLIKGMNENGWTLGGFVATIMGHDSSTLARLSRMNILLVGQSQNLTDTLLVCSYDPKTQDAVLLSIPRDTFVGRNKNYASAYDKINAIYQTNPDLLLEKVCGITGLDIDYYIKVDTHGLRELVDSVGGIYFYVPIDMDYDDPGQDLYIHVKQGYQLLDGDKAEQVLRFRHNNDGTTYPAEYGEQDIGRMKTQRAFITEVIKQLVKPKNITEIDEYIRIANNNVETNFSIWNLKDYAPYLLDFKTENLKTATLPGATEKLNNLWFYQCNKKQTQELIQELFKTEITEEKEENAKIKVSILNGTSDENNLINLQNVLKEEGYTVEAIGTTSNTKTTIIMNRTNKSSEIADKLKDAIGVGTVSNSKNNNASTVDFTIIIGDDYN